MINSDLDSFEDKFLFYTVKRIRFGTNVSTGTINIRAYINDNDYIQLRTTDVSIVLEKIIDGITTEIWVK